MAMLTIAFAALSFNIHHTDAADTEGSIPVSSPEDLARVGSGEDFSGYTWSMDASYHLTNDIVLTGINNHNPIGQPENPFTGVFDGKGHEISGINITSDLVAALFDNVISGEVRNLGLVDGMLSLTTDSPDLRVAGIVGYASDAAISNCYNSCDITVQNTSENYISVCAGGIAGYAISTTISDCYNTGTITGLSSIYARAGGIAGQGYNTTISGCYNTGGTSSAGHNPHAAGIIAEGTGLTIRDSYNTGSVTVSLSGNDIQRAGGIMGWTPEDTTIINCYNVGPISSFGQYEIGGIAGAVSGSIVNSYYLMGQLYNNGSAINDALCSIYTPIIDGPGTNPPRLPTQGSADAKQQYQMKAWLPDVLAGISIYYTGTTSNNGQSVPGWDFVNVWTINENINGGYPILRSQLPAFEESSASISTLTELQISYEPSLTYGAAVTASGLPDGISWDGTSLTGSVLTAGNYTITLTASWIYQGTTVTDTHTIELIVTLAPSFSSPFVELGTLIQNEIIYTPILTDGAIVTASGLPDGISWDGTSLTVCVGVAGEHTITLTASWTVLGIDVTDEQIIHIIVSEMPSFAVDTVSIETCAGESLSYTPILTSGATITTSKLPSGLTWNGTTLSGKPSIAGEYSITLTAAWTISGIDIFDTQTIDINVSPPPPGDDNDDDGSGGIDNNDNGGNGSILDKIDSFLRAYAQTLYYIILVVCLAALVVSIYLRRPISPAVLLFLLILGGFFMRWL